MSHLLLRTVLSPRPRPGSTSQSKEKCQCHKHNELSDRLKIGFSVNNINKIKNFSPSHWFPCAMLFRIFLGLSSEGKMITRSRLILAVSTTLTAGSGSSISFVYHIHYTLAIQLTTWKLSTDRIKRVLYGLHTI